MENDKDLELLRSKKLMELQKRSQPKKEKTHRDILKDRLYDRGEEVLRIAEKYYPKETKSIITKLADLIKSGTLKDYISGGDLLWLFRNIGMKIRIETNIMVEDHGKLFSLKDVLKKTDD